MPLALPDSICLLSVGLHAFRARMARIRSQGSQCVRPVMQGTTATVLGSPHARSVLLARTRWEQGLQPARLARLGHSLLHRVQAPSLHAHSARDKPSPVWGQQLVYRATWDMFLSTTAVWRALVVSTLRLKVARVHRVRLGRIPLAA